MSDVGPLRNHNLHPKMAPRRGQPPRNGQAAHTGAHTWQSALTTPHFFPQMLAFPQESLFYVLSCICRLAQEGLAGTRLAG